MDFQLLLDAAVLSVPGVVILSGVVAVIALGIYFAKRRTKYRQVQANHVSTFR